MNTNRYQNKNIQIIETRKIRLNKIKNITLLFLYALCAFYFLVNGEGLFKNWDNNWTYTTIIYMVGVSVFLSVNEKIPKNLSKPMTSNMIGFMGAFLIILPLFIVLRDAGLYFTNAYPLPVGQIPAVIVFQLVVVVASEEIIFRGILLEVFHQIHWMIAILLSSILFGLFHMAVYGGNLGSIGIAFVLGVIFALCVYRWNIGVAMAIHFLWNTILLGVWVL